MAELVQIDDAPERQEEIPGNLGYALVREPTFAEEQRCYVVSVRVPNTRRAMDGERVLLNFPGVKLGAGNYVITLIRAVLDIRATFVDSFYHDFGILSRSYSLRIQGLDDVMESDTRSNSTYTDTCTLFLPDSSEYSGGSTSTLARRRLTYFSRKDDPFQTNTTSVIIPRDILNLSMCLSDSDAYFGPSWKAPFPSEFMYPPPTYNTPLTNAMTVTGHTHGNFQYTFGSPFPTSANPFRAIDVIDNAPNIAVAFSNTAGYTRPTATTIGTWTGPTVNYIVDGVATTIGGMSLRIQLNTGALLVTGLRLYFNGHYPDRHVLYGSNTDFGSVTTIFRGTNTIPTPASGQARDFITIRFDNTRWFNCFEYVVETIAASTFVQGSIERILLGDIRLIGHEVDPSLQMTSTCEREFVFGIKPCPQKKKYF